MSRQAQEKATTGVADIPLTRDRLIRAYRTMVLIRHFEYAAGRKLFAQGLVKGTIHPYIGEEAVATGASLALQEGDTITSTHRCHGHCLALGGDPVRVMGEILGREIGYCRGRGGSMHIASAECGMLGAMGIVGAGLGIAVGAALANQYQGNDRVVVAFFGDGASNQGMFHESVNMAAIWQLPVVFLCENNRYAVSTNISYSTRIKDIAKRAEGYGIPGVTVDGMDLLAVYRATHDAVERARRGEGPTLIEAKTYRFEGHYFGEPQVYRTPSEVEEWRKRDPVQIFANWLIEERLLAPEEAERIDEEVIQEMERATEVAMSAAFPSGDGYALHVYAEEEI
jgi:TPP-dependent pyruvate/acetoin dehydrogenase alpha subunit